MPRRAAGPFCFSGWMYVRTTSRASSYMARVKALIFFRPGMVKRGFSSRTNSRKPWPSVSEAGRESRIRKPGVSCFVARSINQSINQSVCADQGIHIKQTHAPTSLATRRACRCGAYTNVWFIFSCCVLLLLLLLLPPSPSPSPHPP